MTHSNRPQGPPRKIHPGQRWASESEPELGLGSIVHVTDRMVTVQFAACQETRQYARENAPLRRVTFHPGDVIQSRGNVSLTIDSIVERDGLLVYRGGGRELPETELNDAIRFDQPTERLLNGQVDAPELFDLRLTALERQHRRRRSKVRGFIGGRIQLLPHQLYIAREVSHRLVPRVLLADEVGLGKTIEACLILHRLIQTGRVRRALVLVPEPLIHQWFVELLRRFNLWFHIFDEERCRAIQSANPEVNPFLDDQLVLSSIQWLAGNEARGRQAIEAGWDILVIDEAHHLGWSPESVSLEYRLVEALGRAVPGLLLLTATPEQLGIASHFARLRLLDPDRYQGLDEFIEETGHYQDVARIAVKLLDDPGSAGIPAGGLPLSAKAGTDAGAPSEASHLRAPNAGTGAETLLTESDLRTLADILKEDAASLRLKVAKSAQGDTAARQQLIDALLDQHGTGRVMFRNTRATMTGFPTRRARLQALEAPADDPALLDRLAAEFAADAGEAATIPFEAELAGDPRITWLVDLVRQLSELKVLLICRSRAKAEALDAALRSRITVQSALFHEGLPLVQRDRNAAWFADPEGARILISSEIGSEGRNFQFAHHLVLFDLPADPELLEQRIGRLDRIGQTEEIQIHVPFVSGSAQEVVARWYQEGLNALEANLHGARELFDRFGRRVHDLASDFHETKLERREELESLIQETQVAAREVAKRLEQGRDRLLELNSFRPAPAARLVEDMQREDEDASLENFLLSMFDHFSIHVEELRHRTYHLGSAGVFADLFPGLPAGGLTVTADRRHALEREDIQFLTSDHPLVTGALDLFLGAETGNSSFALWLDSKVRALYLEAVFLVESIAPSPLHLDRFLPPTPLRIVVDHTGRDAAAEATPVSGARKLKKGDAHRLLDQPGFREELLPRMMEAAHEFAEERVPLIVSQARNEMNAQLRQEISRLQELHKLNPNVRLEEIDALIEQQRLMDQHLANARVRLEAVRLTQRGPG